MLRVFWALPLRLSLVGALMLLVAGCTTHPPLTPVSASTLAAELANKKCEKEFGKRPFAPDDFEASMNQGRWRWGTEEGGKVDGFEVEVSFAPDGKSRKVLVRIPEE